MPKKKPDFDQERKVVNDAIQYWKGFKDAIRWTVITADDICASEDIIKIFRACWDKEKEIDDMILNYQQRLKSITQEKKSNNKRKR